MNASMNGAHDSSANASYNSNASSQDSYGSYDSYDTPNESYSSDEMSSTSKLYVGNIDYAATETELANHFCRYGQIEFVNIPVNRYTGRTRGFGFITFASPLDAERAMALNGSEFRGRQIQVNFAKERE